MMMYTHLVKAQRKKWFDPIASVCLFLGVFAAAYMLEKTYWTFDLDRSTAVALYSVFFGMLIGYSRFSLKQSRALIILYSIAIIMWQFIFSLDDDPLWMNRLFTYIYRVQNTIYQLVNSIPLDDGVLFLTGITLFFCIAGLSAGFLLVRYGNPWLPYSAFGIAAVIVQFYLPDWARRYFLLAEFIILTVILFGRLAYIKRRVYWRNQKIREDREVSFSLLRTTVLFALLLSFLTVGLPLIVRELQDNERSIPRSTTSTWDLITNFFFPLKQPVGFGEGGFNAILPLGSSRSLNEEPVFSVVVPDQYIRSGTRFYWYGRVYATFDGNHWQSTDLTYDNLQNTNVDLENSKGNQEYPFIFRYVEPSDIVFHVQETTAIDRPTRISYYQKEKDLLDIHAFLDPGYIQSGEEVLVEGSIRQHTMDDLREASEEYPQWVMDRYLQLPETLPVSVTDLAHDAVGDSTLVIDKVMALTTYLRTNYQYGDSVDIPEDANPLDWFLLEGQTGFCNYYASAEVLMLRTLGIPSRLVAGYAQGEFDDENSFKVKIKDSHAWVEVYFPEFGWVIFEPTPNQPRTVFDEPVDEEEIEIITSSLPQDESGLGPDDSTDSRLDIKEDMLEDLDLAAQNQTRLRKVLIWVSVIALVFVIGFALIRGALFKVERNDLPIFIRERMKTRNMRIPRWLDLWADFEDLGPVQKLFVKLKRYSRWISVENGIEETPSEFIQRLGNEVGLDRENLQIFIDQFHREVYRSDGLEDWQEAEKIYRQILKGIELKIWEKLRMSIRSIFRKRSLKS